MRCTVKNRAHRRPRSAGLITAYEHVSAEATEARGLDGVESRLCTPICHEKLREAASTPGGNEIQGGNYCGNCGTKLEPTNRFCGRCGAAVQPVSEADRVTVVDGPAFSSVDAPRAPSVGVAAGPPPGRASTPAITLVAGLPVELWVVIALFTAPGVYLIWISLKALPDTFRLFNNPYFHNSLAFVLLILLFFIAALGASLLAIAWMLYRADRVGRGLAYIAIAMVTASVAFSDSHTSGEIVAMLASLAAGAVLGLSSAVRAVFTGPNARDRDQPTSIVVARVSIAVWIGLLALAGVLYLFLSSIKGEYTLIGVAMLALAIGAFALYRRLTAPDRQARTIATVGALATIVLLLLGQHSTGFVMLVGLTAAIPICLWLPPDARAFYGDAPLRVATETDR
jgi:hypothetical protein